jgi:hypothetical protein
MDRNRIQIIRWTARIWSIASVGVLLGFVIGEGRNPTTGRERVGLLFFPLGISVGMILAWLKEGIGGIITTGSRLIFYGIHLATKWGFPKGLAWFAFAAPGFFFLLSSYLSRKARNMKQCSCDRGNKGLEELRPGDDRDGEIHGAAYCRICNGIIMCDFCPSENRMVAYVVTSRNYACWEHGDIALKES